jgi:hypothetical protein
MWIFLSIVLFIALIITAILLLPVSIIIKTDQNGEVILRYKLLFKTFGEDPDPDNPIVKTLKEASGLSRLEKENLKDSAQKNSYLSTLSESFTLIITLLKRLLNVLHFGTLKVLKLHITCAEDDAAKTAIDYGRCCALAYPFLGFLHSNLRVRKKGEDINISCDYESKKGDYSFELVLVLRFFRVLGAFLATAFDEAKRISQNDETNQHKNRK